MPIFIVNEPSKFIKWKEKLRKDFSNKEVEIVLRYLNNDKAIWVKLQDSVRSLKE